MSAPYDELDQLWGRVRDLERQVDRLEEIIHISVESDLYMKTDGVIIRREE